MSQFQALRRLTSMSTKDMLRNRLTGLAPVFLFAWLLIIYFVLSLMLDDASADPSTHPLRSALPSILMTGLAGVAFMALTVPLVSMRERGLLRLLGTTPLKRPTFLAAQLPARLALAAFEVAFVIALAYVAGYVGEDSKLWRLLGTLVIGIAMLFACAMLLANRARNAEAVHQGMTVLVMALFVFSGTFLPPGTLPAFTEILTNAIPSTWFAISLGVDLTGATPFLPVPLLWAMMLIVTLVAGLLASRCFEWDQEEFAALSPRVGGNRLRKRWCRNER